VKTLLEAKRIRNSEDFCDFTNAAIPEIVRLIRNYYKGEKRYHIIRLKDGQSREEIKLRLKAELTPDECEIIPWDSSSKKHEDNGDLNDLYLKKKPICHSFILIKQMFTCAKTLCDQHVGVMFERVVENCEDAFILQSLLGRACGYGKSKDTIVFTNMKVVDRYVHAMLPFFEGRCDLHVAVWSLHGDRKGNWKHIFKPHPSGCKIGPVTKRPKQSSRPHDVEPNHVGRISAQAKKITEADAAAAEAPENDAVAKHSAAYDQIIHCYHSFEEAKSKHPRIQEPKKNSSGFYVASWNRMKVMSEAECTLYFNDPKRKQRISSELPVAKISRGDSTCRLIVCYKDLNDTSSVVYYVREAKKKQL
jgi:hypothetical protein